MPGTGGIIIQRPRRFLPVDAEDVGVDGVGEDVVVGVGVGVGVDVELVPLSLEGAEMEIQYELQHKNVLYAICEQGSLRIIAIYCLTYSSLPAGLNVDDKEMDKNGASQI